MKNRYEPRYRCECGKVYAESAIPNWPVPGLTDRLQFCAECGEPWGIEPTPLCDEPGCERGSSCGWPSPEGYRRTCSIHQAPEAAK